MKQLKLTGILIIAVLSSQISISQSKVSLAVKKELEAAEAKMFKAMLEFDKKYWGNEVHRDYVTINADGVMQTKQEAMTDYERKKMFSGMTYKLFDRNIRLYGNVAIINGRSQYLMSDKILAEVYHTEIWIKEKGKWLFNGWQGTFPANSGIPLSEICRSPYAECI